MTVGLCSVCPVRRPAPCSWERSCGCSPVPARVIARLREFRHGWYFRMNVEIAAGVVLIVSPLWFNANFALLGRRFEYPDILRRPTSEILERFRAGGSAPDPPVVDVHAVGTAADRRRRAARTGRWGSRASFRWRRPSASSPGSSRCSASCGGCTSCPCSLARTPIRRSRPTSERWKRPSSARCISTWESASASTSATSSPASGRS